ncbi:hypothetical protein [Leucobacter chinensis]|uniref:hypothetical protein n=1 Tax=Leucobacter chinensis TaxID=2851010 RepID=UPI001C23364E|nr:hypothetical protein [Leucobacter chinensis]
MKEPQSKAWAETTPGIITVNGIIAAVVGSLTNWLVKQLGEIPPAWILGSTAIAAAGVFLLLSLTRRRLREMMWVEPFKFLRGLRLLTAQQRATLEQVGYERRKAEDQSTLSDASKSSRLSNLPAPLPRWTLTRVNHNIWTGTYELKNSIPGAVAYNARLDVKWDSVDLEFQSPAFWQAFTGVHSETFDLDHADDPYSFSALVLSWLDSDFKECSKEFNLPPLEDAPF